MLVTGWGETVTPERTAATGVSRVVSKPFRKAEFLAAVEEVGATCRAPVAAF